MPTFQFPPPGPSKPLRLEQCPEQLPLGGFWPRGIGDLRDLKLLRNLWFKHHQSLQQVGKGRFHQMEVFMRNKTESSGIRSSLSANMQHWQTEGWGPGLIHLYISIPFYGRHLFHLCYQLTSPPTQVEQHSVKLFWRFRGRDFPQHDRQGDLGAVAGEEGVCGGL